jgi:hypothetical protein
MGVALSFCGMLWVATTSGDAAPFPSSTDALQIAVPCNPMALHHVKSYADRCMTHASLGQMIQDAQRSPAIAISALGGQDCVNIFDAVVDGAAMLRK